MKSDTQYDINISLVIEGNKEHEKRWEEMKKKKVVENNRREMNENIKILFLVRVEKRADVTFSNKQYQHEMWWTCLFQYSQKLTIVGEWDLTKNEISSFFLCI